jgi:hypothetical protein
MGPSAEASREGCVPDGHEPPEPELRDDGHDRWLAMRSAYAEYRRTSEALECTRQSADDSTANERLQLAMLEGQQRVAFERYLEARMEFLEFRFDACNWPGASPPPLPVPGEEYSASGSWLTFANPRILLQTLAVILLCATAFSLAVERQHVRDLEAARDELRAMLSQTRNALQQLQQKMDAGGTQSSGAPRVAPAPSVQAHRGSAGTPRPVGQKPSRGGPSKRQPPSLAQGKQAAANREPAPETRAPGIGARTYSFSLVPGRHFKRVGPIEVSLRAVDAERNLVSLSIVSDPVKLDVPRLGLNQGVWINIGRDRQPLELVVDRIARNRLDGHLIERRVDKSELTASQFKRSSASP